MGRYILKRLLMLIPVILGITFITFMLLSYAPGDPAQMILGGQATEESIAELREELGLDNPRLVRYFHYLWDLLHGDMGRSYSNNISVVEQIREKLPNTVLLATSSLIFMIVVGVPIGILSAKKQFSAFDNITMVLTLIGASAPAFWVGLLLVLAFSSGLGWFPSSGMGQGFWTGFQSLILPCITIGMSGAAITARMTRSSMLEVIHEDYVNTARAKGISEGKVTKDHMLSNALIPVVTVVGIRFGGLLGGSVMTETVFSWPGLGKYVVEAVQARDMPVVLGCVVTMSILFSIINLLVDILYAFLDPRIKAQYSRIAAKKHTIAQKGAS